MRMYYLINIWRLVFSNKYMEFVKTRLYGHCSKYDLRDGGFINDLQ